MMRVNQAKVKQRLQAYWVSAGKLGKDKLNSLQRPRMPTKNRPERKRQESSFDSWSIIKCWHCLRSHRNRTCNQSCKKRRKEKEKRKNSEYDSHHVGYF